MREKCFHRPWRSFVGPGHLWFCAASQWVGETASAWRWSYCGFAADALPRTTFSVRIADRKVSRWRPLQWRRAEPTAKLIPDLARRELDASFCCKKRAISWQTDPLSNIFPEVDLSRFRSETRCSRPSTPHFARSVNFYGRRLGSVNGTVVNDVIRLRAATATTARQRDRIRLGETTVHFLVG